MFYLRKSVILILGLLVMIPAGVGFYRSRYLPEPVVLGPGVTGVKKLSSYFPDLEGTINDANVYFLEGEQPGGTMLVLGGTHPGRTGGTTDDLDFHGERRGRAGSTDRRQLRQS